MDFRKRNELIKIATNKEKFKNSISLLQGNASERSIALPLQANHMEPSDLSETILNDDCKCSSQLDKYHRVPHHRLKNTISDRVIIKLTKRNE